jgi:hypothetical protein
MRTKGTKKEIWIDRKIRRSRSRKKIVKRCKEKVGWSYRINKKKKKELYKNEYI